MNYTSPPVGNWQQQQQQLQQQGAAAGGATGIEGNTSNINSNQGEEGSPPTTRSTFVTQVEDNDVLMGRGAPIVDNEGNIRFRQLIRSRLADYQAASSRKEKDDIARQIAATVRSRSGLFLRKIESPEEAQTLGVPSTGSHGGGGGGSGSGGSVVTAWTCVDESAVLVKVKQALRDQGLEAEHEEKKKKKPGVARGGAGGGAAGGTASSSSPRRRKRSKVSSQSGAAAAASSSSPTTEAGGGGEDPGKSSAGGNSDVKIAAVSASAETSAETSPADHWQQANIAALQQQQQQQPALLAAAPSFEMSDAAIANMGRGNSAMSTTQQALLLNQLRQQQLRQQQHELEQHRGQAAAAQLGFLDYSAGSGDFPYSPLTTKRRHLTHGGQGVLGGSIVGRGGATASMTGGGSNMFGGMMASIPELTNMDNSTLLRRGSAASYGTNSAGAAAMMNQHLAGLRPGPRSLLNTAASSSAMNYRSSMSSSSSLPFARAGAQEDYRASPPGRASMGGGLSHADGTSLAQATNFYLGRPQLGGDMMMLGGGGGAGGGISAASLLSGGGFMSSSNDNPMMMRRGEQETATSIETVLQHAVKLCQQLHAITSTTGGGGGRKRFPDQFLSLTQIELCILTVLCSTGLPLWQNSTIKSAPPQAASTSAAPLDNNNDPNNSLSAAFTLTWVNVANQVLQEASTKAAAGGSINNPNNMSFLPPPPTIHGGDHAAKDSLSSSSSSLVAIASHYCKNPKELARATVMLLEKIRQHGDYDKSSFASAVTRTGSFLGSAKTDQEADALLMSSARAPLKKEGQGGGGLFLEAELGRWGTSLDVADSVGNPVAFCIADFLSSYPLVLRHDIVNICAVLDDASCKTLFNHVSNLSRLRDTFQKFPKDHLLVSLGQQASLDPTLSMSSSFAFLDRLPGTSQEERAHLDYSLLRSILELGFLGFFRNTTENLLLLTLRRAGLTMAAMEQRAALLIQALHAHFDSRKRKLVIDEHNGKIAGLIAMAMASSSATT